MDENGHPAKERDDDKALARMLGCAFLAGLTILALLFSGLLFLLT